MTLAADSLVLRLLRGGAVTVAACLLIALLLTLAGPDAWDVNLVYSLSIGLLSWLVIDVGRHWLSRGSGIHWPFGWRGVALVVCGIVLGWGLGSQIGDAYLAHAHRSPRARAPLHPLLITIVVSVGLSSLFYLLGKARYLQMLAEQAQRQAAEMRLKLLQSQLEPHMLFNTLANLRALIGIDPAAAQRMLDHLERFLRSALSASRATTHPLADEFERLRDYLELMAVRMGARLAFALDLPDDLRAAPVPPLLLQPLVENAIRHGLEPCVAGGRIDVSATREGGMLLLTVRDSGLGFDASAARYPQGGGRGQGGGFGLAQVFERVASAHGSGGRVDVQSRPGGGTVVRIWLP